jgi:hypothetical protein
MSSPISNSLYDDVLKSQPEYIYDNTFEVGTNDNLLTDEQIDRMLEYFNNQINIQIENKNKKRLKSLIIIFILILFLIFLFYLF